MTFIAEFTLTFTALFVALDIIGTVPMYLSLTKDMAPVERKRVVDKSMLAGVHKRAPGRKLVWQDGRVAVSPYWSYPEPRPRAWAAAAARKGANCGCSESRA